MTRLGMSGEALCLPPHPHVATARCSWQARGVCHETGHSSVPDPPPERAGSATADGAWGDLPWPCVAMVNGHGSAPSH